MKVEKLRRKLAEEKLDGLLVTDKINRRYLCGFTGSNGLLLVTENALHLFIDGRYTQQAQQQTQGVEICEIPVGGNIIEVLRPFLRVLYSVLKQGRLLIKALLIFKL